MADPTPKDVSGVLPGSASKSLSATGVLLFALLIPALVLFGGSLDLINWGPGLLIVGVACLCLLGGDRHSLRGGLWFTCGFLLFLGLLFLRARQSLDVSAAANNSALIALVAAGFLIGRLAGAAKSRALFIGLSLVALVNLFCTLMHQFDPEWNLIYPERTGRLPSGLFPHYSYSAAFCLGTAGLLVFRSCNERGWFRAVMIGGAACALLTIPISPSRGGNLALALMVAAAFALLLSRAYFKSRPILGMWIPATVVVALALIFAASFVPLIDRGSGHYGFYHDGVRLGYWTAALQIAAQHPWVGGGAGSFAWSVYQVLDNLGSDPVMVHNEALQLAVGYGYPALLAMCVFLLLPAGLSVWRFVDRTDATRSAFAALGLIAMLFQSNFESIFHSAPGAFVAALILGRISRSLWWPGDAAALEGVPVKHSEKQAAIRFFTEVKARVEEHAEGIKDAVPRLAGLLTQSKDPQWRRGAYRLTYWTKTGDEETLHSAVHKLGVQATEEIERLNVGVRPDTVTELPRGWGLARNLALAAIAMPILFSGLRLSRALVAAWEPLYLPERMSIQDRFEVLLRVAEKHRGLGMDRDVLSAAWDSLHQYQSQEAREHWAHAYRSRILHAIPSWRSDPGAALQIAEIAGWAGNMDAALHFYDHAIATQGKTRRCSWPTPSRVSISTNSSFRRAMPVSWTGSSISRGGHSRHSGTPLMQWTGGGSRGPSPS